MKLLLILSLLVQVSCSKLRLISKSKGNADDERNYTKFMSSYLEDLHEASAPKPQKKTNN